jgi:long-chain acyl-CoA synthetase
MGSPEPLTLQSVFEALPAFGSRQAVGLRDDLGVRWWTYAQLHAFARCAAALLRDAGVSRGDHVLLHGQNSPEWVAFFLGAILRGAVVVPIDHDASPDFIRRIARSVEPKALVSSGEPIDFEPHVPLRALYERPAADPGRAIVPVAPADPAVVFFTSGTTSEPRGVVLTHANLVGQMRAFRRWRFLTRPVGWRILVMAPFSHAQGLVVGVAIPLFLGLSAVYTHSSHPAHLIRLLRDNHVPLFSTLPRVLHLLRHAFLSQQYGTGPDTLGDKLQRARAWMLRRHYTFTHMRRVVGYKGLWVVLVGGAPLPRADEDFWRVSGCLIAQGYGLTETTAIVSINSPLFGQVGSVGRPLGDSEVRLAEDGEILVRGSSVAARYLADATGAASQDGFLRTGDIGRVDERNRLFVVGRKKDVIVTGEGFNVHGSDVEAALVLQPGVHDAVVLGLERSGHTEVHAVLLLQAGADAAAIVSRANERLLPYQRIRSWTLWPEPDFPRSALMKPRRQQIAEEILTRGAAHPAAFAPEPESLDAILSIEDRQQRIAALARYVASATPAPDEAASVRLVNEAGLGSLDVIELLALLERQSGLALERIAIHGDVTVSELQALVRNPTEKRLNPFYARDAPRWAELPLLSAIRRVLNPAVLDTFVKARTKLTVSGTENLAGLELPAVFAGGGHEHGFDVLLIHSALPAGLRKRLAIVMQRWVLTDALEPRADSRLADRLLVGLGFHAIVPLFFPFVLISQYTRSRDALLEACRLVDRGYSLIAFSGLGLGVVARQCGVPVVPVRITNPDRVDFRLHAERVDTAIHFERPIRPTPFTSDAELARTLAEFYDRANRHGRGTSADADEERLVATAGGSRDGI